MIKLKGIFEQSGIISRLFLLFGAGLLFATIGIVVFFAFLPVSGNERVFAMLQTVGMFLLSPLAMAYLWSTQPIDYLKLRKKPRWNQVLLVMLFMVVIVPFINLLGDMNSRLVLPHALAGMESWMKAKELEMAQFSQKMVNVHSVSALMLNLFVMAMTPALGEELFFRGAMQRIFLQRKNVAVAVWAAAIIFSAIHFQFYGFLPRLLLGAFFGYLLIWSDSLWLPIAAHFTNNALAVVFYYFKFNGYNIPDIDGIGTGNTLWLGCVSGVVAVLGIWWFRKGK